MLSQSTHLLCFHIMLCKGGVNFVRYKYLLTEKCTTELLKTVFKLLFQSKQNHSKFFTMTPFLAGAYMAVSTVGPAAGFIAGGQFLKIWGDVGKSNYTEYVSFFDNAMKAYFKTYSEIDGCPRVFFFAFIKEGKTLRRSYPEFFKLGVYLNNLFPKIL